MNDPAAINRIANEQSPSDPVYRAIVGLDVERSTDRRNLVKVEMRRTYHDLTRSALEKTGISPQQYDLWDRGDGVAVLIRPDDAVPQPLLLIKLIPTLAALLAMHNSSVTKPELRLRMRVVIHAGNVHGDPNGFFGEALDVAFRLLDSRRLKETLRETTASPLVLVVSQEIYDNVVYQGHVDPDTYEQSINVHVGGRLRRGWVHIPPSPDDDPDDRPALNSGASCVSQAASATLWLVRYGTPCAPGPVYRALWHPGSKHGRPAARLFR